MRIIELNSISFADLVGLTLPTEAAKQLEYEVTSLPGAHPDDLNHFLRNSFVSAHRKPIDDVKERILNGDLWLVQSHPFFPAILEIKTLEIMDSSQSSGGLEATLNPKMSLAQTSKLESVMRHMSGLCGVNNEITKEPIQHQTIKPPKDTQLSLVRARWIQGKFNTEHDSISGWIQVKNQIGGENIKIEVFGELAPNEILHSQELTLNASNKRYEFTWPDLDSDIEIEEANLGDLQFRASHNTAGEKLSDLAQIIQPLLVQTPYLTHHLPKASQPGLAEAFYPEEYTLDAWKFNCRNNQEYLIEPQPVTYASQEGKHILTFTADSTGIKAKLKGPWQEPLQWQLEELTSTNINVIEQGEITGKEGSVRAGLNSKTDASSIYRVKLIHPDGFETLSPSFEG